MEVHASDWLGGRGLSPAEERHTTLWISECFVYSGNVESMRVDSCSIIYEEECEVGLAQWLYF